VKASREVGGKKTEPKELSGTFWGLKCEKKPARLEGKT